MDKVIITLTLSLLVLSVVPSAKALMTSTNYRLYGDELGIGGNRSTSTSYILEDTAGGLSTGDATSTNYTLLSGFQSLSEHPTFTFSISSSSIDLGQLSPVSVTSQ